MKACYFGSPHWDNPRNKILISGLRENGIEVAECFVRHRRTFLLPIYYIILFLKFFSSCRGSKFIIVGWPGNYYVPLAKLITLFFGGKVVFDAHMSQYDTVVNDRRLTSPKSLWARRLYHLDRIPLLLADFSLLDTKAHADYIADLFNVDRRKLGVTYVGVDTKIFHPVDVDVPASPFIVEFHGYYIPLQGTKKIIGAAHILADEDIVFKMIGEGQEYGECVKMAGEWGLENVQFMKPVSINKVSGLVSGAHVVLGIFGDSEKAKRVIPNKVYEAMACRKCALTADTVGCREMLVHGENAHLCENTSRGIAQAILRLREDGVLREKIGKNAYETVVNRLSPRKVGESLIAILEDM